MKLTDSPSASSPSAEPPRRGKSPLKRAISWVLRIGVTATLFLLLFRPDLLGIHVKFIKPLRLGELWAAIKEVRLSTFALWFGLAMAIKACGVFSSMLRWRLLLLGQGIRMRFWSLVGAFLVGRWIGMFSPGTLGLDGYRLYFVGRHTGKWVESTAVIAVEKLTGFIALALLVFLTLPLGMMFFTFKLPILVVILAILGSSILISLACLLNPRILQVLIAILPFSRWAKVQSKFDRLAASVTAYSGQRPLLLGALAFGIVVHFATAIMYFCTAMAIRTEGIRIIHILFASPLMITATVIGPSVGGEGIREIVFVMLLGSHVGQAKTFLFSHLGVWTDAWLCLAGGLFWMLRPADYRPRIDLLRFAEQQGRALSLLSPAEVRDYRLGVWRTLVASAMGGLIGGALTGMIEGVYVLAIAHGLAGLGAGLGLACVALFFSLWRDRFWAPATTFGFSAAGAFGAMGFVFFRFRYVRDFLDEQKPPLSDDLHLLLIAALGFVVIYCAFRWLARRRWLGALARLSGGLGLFAAVSAVFLGYGWAKWQAETGPPAPPPAPPELAGRANVLLIVVDTLRADHTNPYGCTALQTPVLNALAADGVVFEQAVAQASWTRPSIATILTGLYPSTHGAASKADRLGAKAPTLPQTLRDAGFFTVGLVNNFNISGYFGFNKGFTHYRYLKPTFHLFASDSCSRLAIYDILRAVREKVLQRLRGKDYVDVMDFYWPAEKVVDVADDWLDRFKDTPFFYFVHFMDPHDPYMLHPLSLRKGFARLGWGSLTSQDRDPLHDAYLGEIQYVDGEIGRLVAHLKEQGLYDNMAIILTGDHGEEFLDHGGWWHGRTLYEEMIHVPLIVKLPGNALAGTRVPYQVRHIDIAPTICRLMGVEPPPFMQGVPLVQGGQLADPKLDLVFSQEDFEANVVQSARGLRWKLQVANQGNPRGLDTVGLYDLQSPMKENFNLALIEPQRVHEMDSWLLKELNKAEEKGKEYR